MKRAINELEIRLSNAETNMPVWEAEGNVEQAQVCFETIQSIKRALVVLRAVDSLL